MEQVAMAILWSLLFGSLADIWRTMPTFWTSFSEDFTQLCSSSVLLLWSSVKAMVLPEVGVGTRSSLLCVFVWWWWDCIFPHLLLCAMSAAKYPEAEESTPREFDTLLLEIEDHQRMASSGPTNLWI